MTDKKYIRELRVPTSKNPLRILVSSCLIGTLCGVDGSSNGTYPNMLKLNDYPNVKITPFCPEDFSFGTPRETPDIEGGTGEDVLDGNAKVITESGKDITKGMISGAERMLEIAINNKIELSVLMDVSGACGSQVIYKGHRFSENTQYQIGMGVCAALLHRNGIKIISQRDYESLEILYSKIDSKHSFDEKAIDHDKTDWFINYFKN